MPFAAFKMPASLTPPFFIVQIPAHTASARTNASHGTRSFRRLATKFRSALSLIESDASLRSRSTSPIRLAVIFGVDPSRATITSHLARVVRRRWSGVLLGVLSHRVGREPQFARYPFDKLAVACDASPNDLPLIHRNHSFGHPLDGVWFRANRHSRGGASFSWKGSNFGSTGVQKLATVTKRTSACRTVLLNAWEAHPERFVHGAPEPPAIQSVVYINRPEAAA